MEASAASVVVGSLVFALLTLFIFLLLLYLNRRVLRHKEEMHRMESARQREMLQASFEAQEKERKRIGSDIHDDIGPLLSTVKLLMNRFKNLQDPQAVHQHITRVNQRMDEAIQLVRTVARDLTPVVLNKFGLLLALEDLCDRINQSEQLEARLQVQGREYELNPQTELALYRIIQELCNNAIRHAEAAHIQIHFAFEPERLQIKVADDGKGLPSAGAETQKIELPKGIGLRNIEARTSMLGAEIRFESSKNKGTTAILHVPMPQAQALATI
ncbi:MAG: sensor histidine kinase [Phaeodactylibacter sp.]|nr:sensor histidine kinase [Phaeodactylibacter sp.]